MSNPQDPNAPQNQPAGGYPPGQGGHPDQTQGYPSQGYPDQQSYSQQGYPDQQGHQAAASPPGAHHGAGKISRPGVLVVATVLWVLTGLILLLFGLGAALAGGNQVMQDQIDMAVAQSGVQVDTDALQQGVVIGGIVVAVIGALLILLPFLMLKRSNLARILLTVLGAILAVLLLGTVIGTLVVLAAIVLQFLPAANAWFRAPRSAV